MYTQSISNNQSIMMNICHSLNLQTHKSTHIYEAIWTLIRTPHIQYNMTIKTFTFFFFAGIIFFLSTFYVSSFFGFLNKIDDEIYREKVEQKSTCEKNAKSIMFVCACVHGQKKSCNCIFLCGSGHRQKICKFRGSNLL